MTEKSRYHAPALTKGLEILELLATRSGGLSTSDISLEVGRSINEIFRMLQVLEQERYIMRSANGYELTNRLFALGMGQPPVRNLVAAALPAMQGLAQTTGQSCHLAVASGAEMVVVAGVEAPGLCGFAVRIGYRRPLHQSASGRVLLAFRSYKARAAMLDEVRKAKQAVDVETLAIELDRIVAEGSGATASPLLTGITDLAVPILTMGTAVAALTVPFVDGPASHVPLSDTLTELRAAATAIAELMMPVVQERPSADVA